MIRKTLALFVCTVITFFVASNADATTVTEDGLNIEFHKGTLSVDIKDIDVKLVFKALEEKGKIEIFNKKIVPDKKISLKFSELKTEEGIKKLMHACGVNNYATIFTKEPKTGEPRVAKLILVKTAIGPLPTTEVPELEEKQAEATVPIEEKAETPEALGKEIRKAQREAIIKSITPILNEADEETRQAIIKDIMEGKVEAFAD